MRNRHHIIIAIVALVCIGMGWTLNHFPKVENHTFQNGEFLKFRVHYGLVTAGYASIEVAPNLKEKHGKSCHHLIGRGWTSSGFDIFYKVRDCYESYVDKNSLLPVQFNRGIKEGKFESYTEVRFDQVAHTAYYTHRNKQISPYKVPPNIQDVISSFYFARATNNHAVMKNGDRFSLRNFIDRKTFGLEAELVDREKIKVDGQKYNALHFKLLIEEAGLITDGSKIDFWISDDDNKIPLRIQSDLMIGSLKADLIETKGLKHPFTSKIVD